MTADSLSAGSLSAGSLSGAVLGGAAARGDLPAFIVAANGRLVGYQEFDTATRRVATGFAEAGVGPGEVVAVFSPPSPAVPVAVHAALRAGAAVTLVEPGATAGRLTAQLADTGARRLVADPALLPVASTAERNMGAGPLPLRELFALEPAAGRRSIIDLFGSTAPEPQVVTDPHAAAVLLRTANGSGGAGIERLTHADLTELLDRLAAEHPLAAGERVLAAAPFTTAEGLAFSLNHTLRSGATVVEPAGSETADLVSAVESQQVATVVATEAVLRALAEHTRSTGTELPSLVRAVAVGPRPDSGGTAALADALGVERIHHFSAEFPAADSV